MESDYKVFWFFAYSSTFSALIPLGIALVKFKGRTYELKLLCILSFLAFCSDFISQRKPGFANEVTNSYLILEFCILILIYAKFLELFSKAKALTTIAILLYVGFFTTELLQSTKVEMNSNTLTFTSLLFIGFAVRYFYLLMRDLPAAQIQRLPMFWVNTGVLTYFAGGLFLFAMRNYLISVFHDDQTIYWSFHNFLNIVKNLLFSVALWQDLRKPKPI